MISLDDVSSLNDDDNDDNDDGDHNDDQVSLICTLEIFHEPP